MNAKTRGHVTEGWTPAHWPTLFGETTDMYERADIVQATLLGYERPLFRLLVAYLESLPEQEAFDFAIRLDDYWTETGVRFGNYQPPFVADLDPGHPVDRLARYALGFYDGEPAISGYRGDDDPGAWLRAFLRERVDEHNSWILDDVLAEGTFEDFWLNFA